MARLTRRLLTRSLVLGAALLTLALPAQAGLFDDEVARTRIEELRKEFDALTQRMETVSRNQLDFANQFEALRAEQARLSGQIEVLTNDLDNLQKRQKDFYIDLDTRLRKLEPQAAAEAPGEGAAAPQTAQADPASEGKDYEAALNLLKGAKYKDAVAAYQGFIKAHPNSALLAGAHYWMAFAHHQLKEYPRAAELFAKVAATWPADPKAPDALLGQANSLEFAGQTAVAQKVLEHLVEKYPASSAAQSAKPRLKAAPKKKK
ncbi:MAG: tol-pal system protein YbgF [Rhodocyclaceae bacterium]|nr:tol-pal system protein YbgF [Rhodocyclaceae bacterium]